MIDDARMKPVWQSHFVWILGGFFVCLFVCFCFCFYFVLLNFNLKDWFCDSNYQGQFELFLQGCQFCVDLNAFWIHICVKLHVKKTFSICLAGTSVG